MIWSGVTLQRFHVTEEFQVRCRVEEKVTTKDSKDAKITWIQIYNIPSLQNHKVLISWSYWVILLGVTFSWELKFISSRSPTSFLSVLPHSTSPNVKCLTNYFLWIKTKTENQKPNDHRSWTSCLPFLPLPSKLVWLFLVSRWLAPHSDLKQPLFSSFCLNKREDFK